MATLLSDDVKLALEQAEGHSGPQHSAILVFKGIRALLSKYDGYIPLRLIAAWAVIGEDSARRHITRLERVGAVIVNRSVGIPDQYEIGTPETLEVAMEKLKWHPK